MVNILTSDVESATVMHTLKLIVPFAIVTSIVSAIPIQQEYVRKCLKLFSIINFLLLAYMVLFKQNLYLNKDVINYMTYGYWMLISSLVFAYFYCRDDDKFMLILSLVSGLFILFFGSRFGIVSYIFGFLFLYLYIKGDVKKSLLLISMLIVLCVVLITNAEIILVTTLSFTEEYELTPTSLYRLLKFVNEETESISSGRNILYLNSIDIIKNNPMGVGIYGYYRDLLDGATGLFKYPHNLFIQFVLEFGIFGGTIIILFLSVIIYLNLKLIKPNKGWLFVLVLMFNLKLLVSGTYLWEPAFWMAITLGIKNLREHKMYMEGNK